MLGQEFIDTRYIVNRDGSTIFFLTKDANPNDFWYFLRSLRLEAQSCL